MHEELNQKISQLLDNELGHDEALKLLKQMQMQPELQDKLNRYEAVSHALNTEVFILPASDFAARISQQIQQEPNYLLSQRQRFQYGYKMLALAASVAAVAVIASWDVIQHQDPAKAFKVAPLAQLSPQQNTKPIQNQAPEKTTVLAQEQASQIPLNQRINDYLQAHNNSVYTNGEANFKPYTQVTAYGRE